MLCKRNINFDGPLSPTFLPTSFKLREIRSIPKMEIESEEDVNDSYYEVLDRAGAKVVAKLLAEHWASGLVLVRMRCDQTAMEIE